MNYAADLCILYLYHECDPLTKFHQFHLESLRQSNPRAIVLPLTDSIPELLPGSVDCRPFAAILCGSPKVESHRCDVVPLVST